MDVPVIWILLFAPIPVRMAVFWTSVLVCFSILNFGSPPFNIATRRSRHVQSVAYSERGHTHGTCQGERCDTVPLTYTREQLLSTPVAPLTPELTSRLRDLDIGFCLPRKRSRRGGRRKQRRIKTIISTFSSDTLTDTRPSPSSSPVNFDNLISIPLSPIPPSATQLIIALFNARSVNNPEKRTEITSFVTDNDIQLMFLTETWLRARGDDAKCADLTPAGYSIRSIPRPSRGGGLAVIFHERFSSRISFTTTFPFDHSSFELVRVSLSLSQQTVNFFCIYRPPPSRKNKQTDAMFLDQLHDLLELCNSLSSPSVILGDFNIHFDNPLNPTTTKMMDLLTTFGLTQAVREATHEKGHILDWLLHRCDDDLVESTVVSSTLSSDHFCIISHLNISLPPLQPTYVMARNLKAIDRPAFQQDLKTRLSDLTSPTAADLDSVMTSVLDDHAPATRRKVSSGKSAPWFSAVTEEVHTAKQHRRRMERQWKKKPQTITKQLFNYAKKVVSKLIHKAKTNYFCNKIRESRSCGQLFSVAGQLLGNKKQPPLPTIFPLVELPNRFLHYFKNKISTIRNNLDILSLDPPGYTERCFHGQPLTHFSPVTEDFIRRSILSSPIKTCALDPLPANLFTDCLDCLLPYVTAIVNSSLSSGMFPTVYKSSLVKPLLKKPSLDPNNMSNYRPVSNLPFLSKLLERVILSQLQEHLNKNNLLSPLQSAYRPHHSTETALLKIMNDLLTALDGGKVCVVTLLDLSAAFDTIDHNILLCRLQHSFGISGSALSWFESYLTDRTETVSVNGHHSSSATVCYGVPQGSVLGPVLFILYTQPLFDLVHEHSVNHHAFADDNQIYKETTTEDLDSSIETIQNCIIDVKSWMNQNKLQLNDDKTEAILIVSNRMSVQNTLPTTIQIGNSEIAFANSVKNLGVTLDSNLTMKQHVSNTCRAAYIQLRHISSIRHLLTTQAAQTLVCSLVLSRLDYCNSLLFGCPQYLLQKLQRVQNAAARLVCKAKKTDHIQPLLASLHWLPISARIQFKISTFCFYSFTGTAPQYISELLHTYVPTRQLRSGSDTRLLITPRTKTKSLGERSFSHSAPSLWNSLPQDLRHSGSCVSFKTALKTHFFKAAY